MSEKNAVLKRYIGLRNIVTSKTEWKRLSFYEIDGHNESAYYRISDLFKRSDMSFLSYKTLNGYHFVGLSPISATYEGKLHDTLQRIEKEYFSGQTLRLSLKQNERQQLMEYSFRYPFLERLAGVYIKRFNIPKSEIPTFGEIPKYACVFEKYWTGKI